MCICQCVNLSLSGQAVVLHKQRSGFSHCAASLNDDDDAWANTNLQNEVKK